MVALVATLLDMPMAQESGGMLEVWCVGHTGSMIVYLAVLKPHECAVRTVFVTFYSRPVIQLLKTLSLHFKFILFNSFLNFM